MRGGGTSLALVVALALAAHDVLAQSIPLAPQRRSRSPQLQMDTSAEPSAESPPKPAPNLRAHLGTELATRLVRSSDPDERLRGLERAAALGTSEAVTLLLSALETAGAARLDARALVAVTRGLSAYTTRNDVRNALQGVVIMSPESSHPAAPQPGVDEDEVERQARVEMSRAIAALALASSTDPHAVENLVTVARGGGVGQAVAARALLAFPPASTSTFASGTMSVPMIQLAAELGDLRALDGIVAATRAGDATTRAAALRALAEMGDARSLEGAHALAKDPDAGVRAAATEALVLLGAPDRLRALESLLGDDATALEGARIAAIEQDDGVLKALAARIAVSADPALRRAVVVALGRSSSREALEVLTRLTADAILAGNAADAIARSPSSSAMGAIVALLGAETTRRLGARAYEVRALVRDERDGRAEEALARMAASPDGRDRAAGLGALVALGRRDLSRALADPDVRVRRAVAVASLALEDHDVSQVLLARLAIEPDEVTRQTLGLGLRGGDPDARLTTFALFDRAESGAPDAPLAAMAIARRTGARVSKKVDELLAARDPLLRAHTARGLAASSAPDAIGRLTNAYAYEHDDAVRRALLLAIAARTQDADAPSRRSTLRLAARLDPDPTARAIAKRARVDLPAEERVPSVHEVAWLRLATRDGAPPATGMTAALVRVDGLALPIAFDDDGYAVVPIPPGEARLVLAPRLPAYEASSP